MPPYMKTISHIFGLASILSLLIVGSDAVRFGATTVHALSVASLATMLGSGKWLVKNEVTKCGRDQSSPKKTPNFAIVVFRNKRTFNALKRKQDTCRTVRGDLRASSHTVGLGSSVVREPPSLRCYVVSIILCAAAAAANAQIVAGNAKSLAALHKQAEP